MADEKSLTPSFDGKFEYELEIEVPQGLYRDKAKVQDNARSFKIVHRDGQKHKAVLCFQGYQGYPGEMAAFAKRIYMAGFDVWAPRNPGMGTSWDDFYNTSDKDWLNCALFFCKSLSEKYGIENLYLAGHSMGCALCALCAREYPVKKMVFFAPGIGHDVISPVQRRMLKLAAPLVKRKETPWQHDDSYHFEYEAPVECDYALGKEYWSYMTPTCFLAADRLFIESFDVLSSLKTDVLIFIGGKDPLITVKGCENMAAELKKGSSEARVVFLEKCTHGIPYDIDLPSMDKAFTLSEEFLKK
ncbi:MAG: alpha/beta fold hydrolase [Sphaerochaetaceae bacterium]|nr:alpha/beta fold hydrolase [Sphaerochaetaceae bacterium]